MKKFLIVGLGNPGDKYASTRHNLGARVVAAWMEKVGGEWLAQHGVSCLLPTEFMNETGKAVAAHLKNNPLEAGAMLLVHDELELAFGEIKLMAGGSAKGHNGVKSVHEALGTKEIPRLRLGVGRPPEGVEPRDYVLGALTAEEEVSLSEKVIPEALKVLHTWAASTPSPRLLQE